MLPLKMLISWHLCLNKPTFYWLSKPKYSKQVKETWEKLSSNLIFIQDKAKKFIQKY